MQLRKVLLLNPPSEKRYSRDYYCGDEVKGNYYWPPTDLLVLSGLCDNFCELKVIDAIVDKKNLVEVLDEINHFSPDGIISLASSVSWNDDIYFFKKLFESYTGSLFISGDYPRAEFKKVLKEHSYISGIIYDFTDCDIVKAFAGENRELKNIITKENMNSFIHTKENNYSYGVPRHDLFPLQKYHMPMAHHHPFTTLITDYGCAYKCSFCFYERIGQKLRNISNIKEELDKIHEMGVRQIFINDPSFFSHSAHSTEVCDLLTSYNPPFKWIAGMRVDNISKEVAQKIKRSGCVGICFGVETGTEKVLDAINKKTTRDQIQKAFEITNKYNIDTLAHCIIGLKGETEKSLKDSTEFIFNLAPTFATFNVAMPVWDTSFREELVKENLLENPSDPVINISTDRPTWESKTLSKDYIEQMKQDVMRQFYLRPHYIIKQILRIRTYYQLQTLLREGFYMLKKLLGNKIKS